MRIVYATLVVLLLATSMVGCRREEPEKPASNEPSPDVAADFDQDGLADVDEREVYHTSPEAKDTDGDGYDDYQEIHDFGYDPSNPTKFNPLVADVPAIEVGLTTPPKVNVVYRKTKGGTETVESGETHTTGSTYMMSYGGEESYSISATAGYTWGPMGGANVSVTGTYGQSWNWTKQNSQENQKALSTMRSHSQNEELTAEGGNIKAGVTITNAGHVPFTVQSLSFTAFRPEGTRWFPVAQLEVDSNRLFSEIGTWAPRHRVDGILFKADSLPLAEVEEILTGDLQVRVSKYELKDANGQSFAHRMGAIDAACARVVIDYGGNVPGESYMVAARAATDARGVPVNTVLDTLGIPHEAGTVAWTYRKRTQSGLLATGADATETSRTRNGLLRLRSVAADPQQGGYWLILHETPTASSEPVTQRYDLLADDYRLEDICLKPRQTIQLAYVRDPDHDGLSTPAEDALGTKPWEADTDGDGVADSDEIQGGTDPLWDNALPLPGIGPVEMKKFGQQVDMTLTVAAPDDHPAESVRIQWGDGSFVEEVKDPRGTITRTHHYATVGKYKIVMTPYAGPRSPGKPHEVEVSTAPALVRKLTVQFGTKGLDRLHQLAVDRQGNAYLAGDVSDMTPLASMEPGRVFLAKHGPGGEQEWVVQFGPSYELPGGLAVDPEGNVHLATYDSRSDPKQPVSLRQYTPARGLVRNLTIEDERPVRDLATAPRGYTYYYAQERWLRDAYGMQSNMAESYGGPKAREQFARLTYGQELKIPVKDSRGRPGGTVGLVCSRRPDVFKMAIPADAGREGGGRQTAWNSYLPSDVSVQAIALDASGGLYACGYRRVGLLNAKEKFNDGSFVARLGPGGKLDWMRWHGDNEHDQAVAIGVDGPGNAYVVDLAAGWTPDKPNRGRFDVRLVKYSPQGEILWMRQFGTRLLDVAFSVAVWPTSWSRGEPGNAQVIYVAGVTQGNLYDETADLDPAAKLSAFLVAYDSDGSRTFLEQFPLGADVPQEVRDLRLPTWGQFEEAFKAATRDPEEARRLITFRPAGEPAPPDIRRTWWRTLPVAVFLATDAQGDVYCAGSSQESLGPGYNNKGGTDIFLMRFVPNPEVKK